VRKYTVIILNQLNIKNIKLTDNFEKNHKKKTVWGMIVVIHGVLNKKNTKLNYQSS
jgi:hypothetical protein